LIADPKPHIGGNLVIAASSGVQFRARRARGGCQGRLHGHVDVLKALVELEFVLGNPLRDVQKPFPDLSKVALRDDSLPGEHLGVRNGAGDVIFIQPLVYGKGLDEFDHRTVRAAAKALLPRLFFGAGHAYLPFGSDSKRLHSRW